MHSLASCLQYIQRRLLERKLRLDPSLRGSVKFPPGHFYSPLLDLKALHDGQTEIPFDGVECWEHIQLRPREQRAYYEDLLENFPIISFPQHKSAGYHYFWDNNWFPLGDAFTLSGVLRKEKPGRIIEVGSGFSSAVMLDTLRETHASARLTFIEPYPERLRSLLSSEDTSTATLLVQRVQEIPIATFDQLEAQDILFIDSSHVAKIGSDVVFLLLRVLPRLKPGVLVHFHDIFYPFSYPVAWTREGIAWNESLFLRAFLVQNLEFEIVAFNMFAGRAFPELFKQRFPEFLKRNGGSLWLRKVK